MKNWRDYATEAILNRKKEVIRWPNKSERREIAQQRFKHKFGWRNRVFIIDGKLFHLTSKPQVEDYPDYFGGKLGYTVNAVILCDDQRRILYYLADNPGTCHDRRAWGDRLQCTRTTFLHIFLKTEYGLGDSAFGCEWFLLSAFSRSEGAPMTRPEEIFNEQMSKPRVVSEHANGILKGPFSHSQCSPPHHQGKEINEGMFEVH